MKITIWARDARDLPLEYDLLFEHNHIEDGWVEGDKPVGDKNQTKLWANYRWKKKFGYLIDGHVRRNENA